MTKEKMEQANSLSKQIDYAEGDLRLIKKAKHLAIERAADAQYGDVDPAKLRIPGLDHIEVPHVHLLTIVAVIEQDQLDKIAALKSQFENL